MAFLRISVGMKRLNPQTSELFKRGDVRDDGLLFWNYKTCKLKQNGFFAEAWHTKEVFEKKLKWAKDNRHLHNEWAKAYQQTEKGQKALKRAREKYTGSPTHIANNSKRRAAKLQRTPKWLTAAQLKQIADTYAISDALTKITGIPHEVDHVVPLQGKNVSGLHVPWNLHVKTAEANRKKSNKHEV